MMLVVADPPFVSAVPVCGHVTCEGAEGSKADQVGLRQPLTFWRHRRQRRLPEAKSTAPSCVWTHACKSHHMPILKRPASSNAA